MGLKKIIEDGLRIGAAIGIGFSIFYGGFKMGRSYEAEMATPKLGVVSNSGLLVGDKYNLRYSPYLSEPSNLVFINPDYVRAFQPAGEPNGILWEEKEDDYLDNNEDN